MKLISALLFLAVAPLGGKVSAQLIAHPVDIFERVRWGMTVGQLRMLAEDSMLTPMVSRRGATKDLKGMVTFRRGEIVFGQPQSVGYRVRTADSTVQQIFVSWVDAAATAAESSRNHDSLWVQMEHRYGPTTTKRVKAAEEREWTTATSIIKAVRVRGRVSGVVIIARPASSPP